jgi:MFS transporter, DHA1 family, multidrug resistance protein
VAGWGSASPSSVACGAVTGLDTSSPDAARARLVPGSRAFIVVLAACMAVTALAIDASLPAFPEIRTSFDLADDATSVTGIITFFFIGSSLGLLPAGILADRYGRRPVMWAGLALYVVGAVLSIFAPSLWVMFVARFIWGLGSAGPRVAALAMVRDAYDGEQMAKQMSLIMAVFILVPAFAPSLATAVLLIGPWQAIFWLCAAVAVLVGASVSLLPETLAVESQRALNGRDVGRGLRAIVTTPGTLGYLIALTAMYGVFLSYLASSEIILDQVFGLEQWFPVFFGGIAVAMGFAMYVNGRVVERLGLRRIIRVSFVANLVAGIALLAVAVATSGKPPFLLFVVLLGVVLFFQQMLIPNLNAAAMNPLGHVAGTAAALLGMIPGVVGAVIGSLIDRQFDGTVRPIAIGFVVSSAVAFAGWLWAIRAEATSVAAAAVTA